MCDLSRQEAFRAAWCDVRKRYDTGFIVSERGLQAALYEALGTRLGGESQIVVEPKWEEAIPDLVITRQGAITDIFELKFTPHLSYSPTWVADHPNSDIKKLLSYVGTDKRLASLDPETGQYDDSHCVPVQDDCRLHFVVVARRGREEQWPQCDERVTRWCGCTGDRYADPWYICRA